MTDISDSTEQAVTAQKKEFGISEWLPILGILILVALVYAPVIANAFNGDDFVHLAWLAQAVKQPELVLRNFHSPWLDITTAKFYRPLISIFMLTDYLIWQSNGIGFHLTNLLCHLGNTLMLWLILRQIEVSRRRQNMNYMWCLAAAALFGLYPLHPEAVSWITGRVDTFVTLFSLGSMYCYMRWADSSNKNVFSFKQSYWLYFSLLNMWLALLCKEMAIILPAVFCLYELTLAKKQSDEMGNIRTFFLSMTRNTSLFWLLLFTYLGVRYWALGTLVGGYDNSVFSLTNWHVLLSNWRRSLYLLFFPFNTNIVAKGNLVICVWAALVAANLVLIVKQVFIDKKNVAVFLFLLGWLILTLVPVYKLFNIAFDLQGSRLAYLATVPLCALFCFGYAGLAQYNYWRLIPLTILVSVAGAGLLVNNSAWIEAEKISQSVLKQLNVLTKVINADQVVYIVGLPDQINGAYICRNALDGMSKYPQISKDMRYCFNLDEINHVFPFGYARNSMVGGDNIAHPQFLVWDGKARKLMAFSLSNNRSFQSLNVDTTKDVSIEGDQALVNLRDQSCFDIDCLVLRVNVQPFLLKHSMPAIFSLFYANTLYPEFAPNHRIDASLNNDGEQELIFPLRGQADWAMGEKSLGFKLVFPKAIPVAIKNITVESAIDVMPVLTFQPNVNQNQLGFIELSPSHPTCQLAYDGSKVVGAQKIALEITSPDQTFVVSNDQSGQVSVGKKLKGLKGLLLLNKDDFCGPGIYELRLRALINNDQPIGIAGDHIVVTVK